MLGEFLGELSPAVIAGKVVAALIARAIVQMVGRLMRDGEDRDKPTDK